MNDTKTHKPPYGSSAYMRCPISPSRSIINDLSSLVDKCKSARCIGLEPGIDFDDRPASCVLLVAAIVAEQNDQVEFSEGSEV